MNNLYSNNLKVTGEKVTSKRGKKEKIIKSKNSEILERKASKFGSSAHVIISKKHLGKKVKIIIEG